MCQGASSVQACLSLVQTCVIRLSDTMAMLSAVEIATTAFRDLFGEVARGVALDSERAHTLMAQCDALLGHIRQTRNALLLSGDTSGVH